jgi:hypothetical protein
MGIIRTPDGQPVQGVNFAIPAELAASFVESGRHAQPFSIPLPSPTAAPTLPPPKPAAPPATAVPTPLPTANFEPIVRDFYRALNEQRYQDAYAYLSRSAQRNESLEAFQRRFVEAGNILEVRRVNVLSTSSTRASVDVHTRVMTRTPPSKVRECTRVSWQLVLEDGQWKRESVSQVSEPC